MNTKNNFEAAFVAAARQFILCFDTYQEASARMAEQTAPVQHDPVIQEAIDASRNTPYEKVMALLNDPRFTLRSASTVQEAAGVNSFEDLVAFFEAHEIYFTTATKRRTGARLVGLASRN